MAWDTSQLYVNGELRIAAAPGLPGDFNHDSAVNAADYVTWRKGVGIESTPANYNLWRTNFGRTAAGSAAALSDATVPEPGALAIALFAAIAYAHRRVRLTRSQRRR